MPTVFLLLSVLGLANTANAVSPLRRPWFLKTPSFGAAWATGELPLHVLGAQAVAVAVWARAGVLASRPGRAGLALTAASWAGLVALAVAHRRAGRAMERALADALGADYRERIDPGLRARLDERQPWWELVAPGLVLLGRPGVERVAGVPYARAGGRDLEVDVFRPQGRPSGCPVLVEVHGGAWVMGDRRLDARPLMARLASHGWVCVTVDYRLSPGATWPDHVRDVKAALAWVREHVHEYGGDPRFVALTGGSAGGHLAALAALTPDDPEYRPQPGPDAPVQACVPFYGVYDFANRLGLRAPGEVALALEKPVVKVPLAEAPDLYERASPLARVSADAPPFLVVQGGADNLVPPAEARAFVERLRAVSRSPVAYAEVPGAQHAFDAVASVRTGHAIRGVERFLAHAYTAHRAAARRGA